MTVLLDGTILSNFAAVGRLDLLTQVLDDAYIATAVRAEVARGIERGHDFLAAIERQITSSNPDAWLYEAYIESEEEKVLFDSMPPKLGRGEAMSLGIAKSRGWTLFTDDAAARTTAQRLGIPISGTLGVLRRLADLQAMTIEQANEMLARMISEFGFRSPVVDLRESP